MCRGTAIFSRYRARDSSSVPARPASSSRARAVGQVGRHRRQAGAARHVLQLDAAAEDAQQRVGLAEGQVGRGAAGRGERDVLAGVQAEAGDRPVDQRHVVARQHPEVVARGVGDAGRQRDLEVTHRAAARGARTGRELAVDPQGRRLAAVGLQDRARRAALLEGRGQPRAAPGRRRRPGVEPECRSQGVPQPGVPGLELAVEVAAGVTLAARVHPRRAARLEGGVDPGRHRLVGRRPVPVAAAEDGVAHPGQRRRRDRRPTCRTSPRCPAAARCRRR